MAPMEFSLWSVKMGPVPNIKPVRKPGPPCGGVYRHIFGALTSVRVRGLLRTGWIYGNRFLRAISFRAAGYVLVVWKLAWMAWGFVCWRLSKLISEAAYKIRDDICRKCKRQVVVLDGRYTDHESRYCGSCGCTHNRWSELTVKNTRQGHICPLFKFPEHAKWREYVEQMKKAVEEAGKKAAQTPKKPKAGCKGCGAKAAGPNGRGHALRGFQSYERNERITRMETTGVQGTPYEI